LVFGIREAAWPLVRLELSLSYLQIGMLLSIPGLVSTIVEPSLALLSDTGHRRRVVLGGGVAFALALLLIASAPGFAVMLAASCLLYPASGAFVSLAQATWMDLEPNATERNMGRWVLAGSLGAVLGPPALGAAVATGSSWRGATLAAAILAVPTLLAASRIRFPPPHPEIEDLRAALRGALEALGEPGVRRWLTLVQLTDLLGDVFLGFVALYLVDVGGASPQLAAVGVGILIAASLLGDALLLPVLERVDSLRYLRWSASAALVAYPAFLLVGSVPAKLVLLVPIGILRAGWYSIPQARVYSALPARGGVAVAIGAPADLIGSLLPLAIGVGAQRLGLGPAMWLLLTAPVALLTLLPTSHPRDA
jgi:FSR family fosmidomycin resistance protein-like MFS transporter